MQPTTTACIVMLAALGAAGTCGAQAMDASSKGKGAMTNLPGFEIKLDTVLKHDDGKFLWFHPRVAAIPGMGEDGGPRVVMTLQQHLHVSDFYSGLYVMTTDDLGAAWTDPEERPELAWKEEADGIIMAVCDVTPGWHAPTGKLLAIGAKVRYKDGHQLYDKPASRAGAYAVHDPATGTWSPWRVIEMPDTDTKFYNVTPGCTQWLVLEDGTLLLPIYFKGPSGDCSSVTVLHCAFDGDALTYVEHGDEIHLDVPRGAGEPSLIAFKGRYYMTIRNDVKGYVTAGDDGLHFQPIAPWTFDDGAELGSYNTQQHWLAHGDGLFLTYTRRGADNDHIFRHRAPLFIAQVDPERLCVIRESERVLIPERGATLGNFGAAPIDEHEAWVTVSEGVWNDEARQRGAEGATFVARVRWPSPNTRAGNRSQIERTVPAPLPDHPGNVFLEKETVRVALPEGLSAKAVRWQVRDDALHVVREGPLGAPPENPLEIGALGIGWYRVDFLDEGGEQVAWTTAAVLAPLAEPIPQDSPVCLDAALSWLCSGDPRAMIQLAALAGVNWQRDRLDWRDVEPERAKILPETKYDTLADLQTRAGLNVLQVFHRIPKWAAANGTSTGHCPDDLRLLYAFCKSMSARFKGSVQAWEPWNEGNARNFGGHTINELCALQKAAYLGFKAGDPGIAVCWNPIGGINTQAQGHGILANVTWPYYDVYSIHSYDWPHDCETLWEHARKAACGRPIWVTECDRGLKALPDSPQGDFAHDAALRKAEFMTHSYASSLFSGAARHFHFILGHYMEGENTIQFGLLRQDLTPRPSYVALAALGRLLAGAKCLGRLELVDKPDAHVYAFRGRPNGTEGDLLVAWTEQRVDWARRGDAQTPWALPEGIQVAAVFDYLGRPLGNQPPDTLTSKTVFLVLPPGEADKLLLRTVPMPAYREGSPCPVVLQAHMPHAETVIRQEAWTQEPDYALAPGHDAEIEIHAYNFSEKQVEGSVDVASLPDGWTLSPRHWEVALDPMERACLKAILRTQAPEDWVALRGAFGAAGQAALAFRVVPAP